MYLAMFVSAFAESLHECTMLSKSTAVLPDGVGELDASLEASEEAKVVPKVVGDGAGMCAKDDVTEFGVIVGVIGVCGGVDDGLVEGVDAGAVEAGMEFEAGVEAKEVAGVEVFVEEGIGMTSFRKRLSKVSAI